MSISLDELKTYGPIYACNAIHREFKPDVLIATDKKMCQEIEATGYPMTHEFWTRRPAPEKGGRRLEKPYYGMSSGPAAASSAALRGFNNIYLIGFDFHEGGYAVGDSVEKNTAPDSEKLGQKYMLSKLINSYTDMYFYLHTKAEFEYEFENLIVNKIN